MRLDVKSVFPSGMETYLSFNGWHFNKKMCEWAVSKMYKIDDGIRKYIDPITKEDLKILFETEKIKIPVDYDAVYVANMCKADFLGSSISNESQLAKYVFDVINDEDSYDGMPFTRFYADCIGAGVSIPWEDLV